MVGRGKGTVEKKIINKFNSFLSVSIKRIRAVKQTFCLNLQTVNHNSISCMKAISRFLIIDDDPGNNILCELIIQKAIPDVDIQTFTEPEEAIDYIKHEYSNGHAAPTVLFLDINMPSMTGWDVLETFNTFNGSVKQQFTIFMVSSSIDPRDKKRASQNSFVTDYIEKPITVEKLKTMFS